METRTARLSVGHSGGTAGAGSRNYKVTLPTKWIERLGLGVNNREMELALDGDRLCSVIYADFTEKQVRADNYTENIVKTAFGRNSTPSWDDFREFLKERCIPGSRSGLNEYLETIGADSSDPLDILPITKGRMAEDDQRLIMEKL